VREPQIDLSFRHAYDVELLTELPATDLARFYFPGAHRDGGRDGILLKVTCPGRAPWIGIFGFGINTGVSTTAVYAMPNPFELCVVTRGAGYLVNAETPTTWCCIGAEPVTDVRVVTEHGIVVFVDLTRLTAYGAAGVRWESDRVAWDDPKIVDVTRDLIIGEYSDYAHGGISRFTVELATGKTSGGVPY
jgi:hypothetical protein